MNANAKPKMIENPVDWDELYPGRFIKAGDFKGKKTTLRIAHVHVEELVGDKGPQMKGIIKFERTDKQLALNKTNGICLKAMFGRRIPDWVGKRVTLYGAPYEGELAIRIWGSPDISEDRQVTIALPRKRPFEMTMHAVKSSAETAAPKPVESPSPPAGDDGSTEDLE